jgi:16S rRNA (cytosine1402-N4)-methyltransferase
MSTRQHYHTPVLLDKVIELLAIKPDGVYLDGTLGGGGHFGAIASRLSTSGTAIGIDRDSEAIAWTREHMGTVRAHVILEQSAYSLFDRVCGRNSISTLDGVLLDLGVSSRQLDESGRGFAYMQDSDLDMRMNPAKGSTAAQIIENSDEQSLAHILEDYGEVKNARRMAHTIKTYARTNRLQTSGDLRKCLEAEYGPNFRIKVLAKVFQALRIAVNDELGELERFLEKLPDMMAPEGRCAIISYHSLEDRKVKQKMSEWEQGCTCPPRMPVCTCHKIIMLKRITKKPVMADEREIAANPRARSARLRVAQKVARNVGAAA